MSLVNINPDAPQEKAVSIFPTTHWTTLLQPIRERNGQAQQALNRLFEIYRPSIVAYVRTLLRDPQHAEDIAQDFILKILEREDISQADRTKGRFRSYLCTCLRHHVISHYKAEEARKRRVFNEAESLDKIPVEPAHELDAEKEFTRRWWHATIDEAVRRLRAEWEAASKVALFEDLEPLLWDRTDGLSISEIALKHRLTPNTVSLRKFRMRDRFKELLITVVSETVESAADAQEEIRQLLLDP